MFINLFAKTNCIREFSLYHVEISQSFHNCRPFFRRTLRLFRILRLRLIIIIPFDNTTLPLDLRDIQAGHLQTVLFQYISLDLLIGSTFLEAGHIHILQRELHTNFLRVDFSLGKQNNRFNMLIIVQT